MGEGGVKNPEKMPTSFMDGPQHKSRFPLQNTALHHQKDTRDPLKYNLFMRRAERPWLADENNNFKVGNFHPLDR